MNTKPISVLLIDDHKLILETWGYLLSRDSRFSVIGQTGSASDAITIATLENPDIVLTDINMRPVDGFEITRTIRMNCPNSKIIGISMYANTTCVKALFQCGATGYVTKNSPKEELFEAILTVSQGKRYLCQEIKDKISLRLLEHDSGDMDPINSLTPREIQIIRLIKEGHSSKEIANSLELSSKTIEVHRYNILKKLKLKNRAELVNFANMSGI